MKTKWVNQEFVDSIKCTVNPELDKEPRDNVCLDKQEKIIELLLSPTHWRATDADREGFRKRLEEIRKIKEKA